MKKRLAFFLAIAAPSRASVTLFSLLAFCCCGLGQAVEHSSLATTRLSAERKALWKETHLGTLLSAVATTPNPLDKTVYDFGSFGDGIHDDTLAIQHSFNYACLGHSLFIPQGKFKITTMVGCTFGANNVRVYGSGPNSVIVNVGNTNGALQFSNGTVTTDFNNLYLDNFRIVNATVSQSPFAIQLFNVSAFGILNVSVEGGDHTTDLVSFIGAQQGYFKGGTLSRGINAFNLQPIYFTSGVEGGLVNSNMIDITSVEIASCTGTKGMALVLNGQDDGNFFGNHVSGCAGGVHAKGGGYGQYNVIGNHFEPVVPGLSYGQLIVDVGYGSPLLFAGNSVYVLPGEIAIDAAGSSTKVYANMVNGEIYFRSTGSNNQFVGNTYYGTLNDASSGLLKLSNDFK